MGMHGKKGSFERVDDPLKEKKSLEERKRIGSLPMNINHPISCLLTTPHLAY